MADTINIGADLAGMADAAGMVTGINSYIFVIFFGLGITVATVRLRYTQLAGGLKWLALVLFVYVACALYIGPDWRSVAHATLVPKMPTGREAWAALVAILGPPSARTSSSGRPRKRSKKRRCLGARRSCSDGALLRKSWPIVVWTSGWEPAFLIS